MVHGHHIIHPAREWSLRPEALRIRSTSSLIPDLDPVQHNRLHRACPPVPLLGYHALQIVNREFEPTRDTIETMDNLVYAIEQAGQHPRAYKVERGVARLAIEAIEAQRPFIQEALEWSEEITLIPLEEVTALMAS